MPRSRRPSPAPQLQAIIFDIGRVIVRVEPGRALAKLAASGKKQARPKNRMSGDDLWQAIQSGTMASESLPPLWIAAWLYGFL
jgi:hypothetical protein